MKFSIAKFIDDFFVVARNTIIKYESYKELTGEQKKDRVDSYVIELVTDTINAKGRNFLLKFIINKFIIPNIPNITQRIFDLIKDNVQGITNK